MGAEVVKPVPKDLRRWAKGVLAEKKANQPLVPFPTGVEGYSWRIRRGASLKGVV